MYSNSTLILTIIVIVYLYLTVVLSGVMSKALSSDWYIGNLMQYGYYRVNYPEENWYNLINQLKTDHTVYIIFIINSTI